ncbi:MAG: hypothetical protein AABX89_02165 [Candidatus Thermoplasmatota archaeon]
MKATGDRAKAILILRVLAVLIAVPGITIGGAFILYTPGEHTFHAGSMVVVAAAAALIWMGAPGLASRLVPEEATPT